MTHNLRAETLTIKGHNGDEIEAYVAVPTDVEQHGSIVVIHHLPGYDEATKEITRRFAANGYAAIMPNLYHREAPGADPDDAAAIARANGGIADEQIVGDVEGAMNYLKSLPTSNGKVASIGFCSGGRQSFMVGCRLPLEGVIDCYGAFVVGTPPAEFPLRVTPVVGEASGLRGEVLGLFGAEDQFPTPAQVDELADALRAAGKTFTFRTYEGAGHAFFSSDRPSYRVDAANEGWREIFSFLSRTVG
ncbi:MAG: dienelactone hydrolase family protein [Acidobacteriota bacterium]|nr:dienelactone hydrolase family protein [Acidobacteriota bacterium]MDE3043544.1 dienelactone hydrolase family protein [Acidobacteriota bacterium]MDE3106893.1 dienelactone hydrolase family protein [Acidobacteriota bacterium]MDE3222550.1 dienelactone hydrolase family protein [Acidobacteriota bacterium]